jgi:hypothetical protein
MLGNSAWQIAMAVTMWCMNRFTRPSWVTGVCIAAGFGCLILAGGIQFLEARRVKRGEMAVKRGTEGQGEKNTEKA